MVSHKSRAHAMNDGGIVCVRYGNGEQHNRSPPQFSRFGSGPIHTQPPQHPSPLRNPRRVLSSATATGADAEAIAALTDPIIPGIHKSKFSFHEYLTHVNPSHPTLPRRRRHTFRVLALTRLHVFVCVCQ